MSNIDYTQICPEFYTNYEDGCCMENCTFESKGYCPVQYVKGLLEEKDKVIENWQTMYKSVMQTCSNDAKEIDRLNKLLAEKDKLLREKFGSFKTTDFIRLCLECGFMVDAKDKDNQDKISFAVEQLEKVKELLLETLYDLYSKPSEIWDKYGDLYDVVVEGAVNGTIDNQIKRLKEMK